MPNNLFESIYAGNDPRLGGLDPAMFQQLYQQYNGALQMWGPEAAQAVLQQQLAGLPQSPVGAGSTGGPGGRGGAPAPAPVTAGAGSAGGPGGRGGWTPTAPAVDPASRGGIAAAAAGAAASQIAPNAGAGSGGGPAGRGGAIPQPVNVGAGSAGGPGGRGGAIPQPVNVGAGATGGPSTRGGAVPTPGDIAVAAMTAGAGSGGGPAGRGGAIPRPVDVGAGATGGPSTRGGAIPRPVDVGAGATGGPSTRGGAIPQPVNVGAGSGAGPAGRGGAIPSDFASTANAGSGGGPGGRGGAIPSDFASTANAGSTGGPGGRGGPGPMPAGQGISPVPPFESADTAILNWLDTEGAANLLPSGAGAPSAPGGSFWADGSPVSADDQWMYDRWGPGPYTDDQIHEWLGTPEAASLLGAGGSNFSDAPVGGGVAVPEKIVDEGFGVDPDFRGGGVDLGVGGRMPFYDPDTWDRSKGLADIERQYGMIDEQRAMTFADQQRQQQQAQRGLPGAFNARGMLNSGQYNRAEGMQAGAFDRARGRTEMGFQAAEDALSRAELEANTGASFGAFQQSFDEADRRAKAASNISGAWY
jgi:hypothetical protein